MLSFANIELIHGVYGKYYIVDGEKYDIHFPLCWAIDHCSIEFNNQVIGSGPRDCNNCYSYGSINGVFVGYCKNCSDFIYKGERGNVSWLYLSKQPIEDIWKNLPYMYGVKKNNIGYLDLDLNEDEEAEAEDEYADMPDLISCSSSEIDEYADMPDLISCSSSDEDDLLYNSDDELEKTIYDHLLSCHQFSAQ
jgi:hypothetical protein